MDRAGAQAREAAGDGDLERVDICLVHAAAGHQSVEGAAADQEAVAAVDGVVDSPGVWSGRTI